MPEPRTLYLLAYEYVADIVERRGPHREGHLARIARLHEEGRLRLGGAVGDPPRGGLFVLRDGADAEVFVAADPYVEAGLVEAWRVDPWTVVTP